MDESTRGEKGAILPAPDAESSPEGWEKHESEEPTFENRCIAFKTDGSRRCNKAAIKGATVCRNHGGSTPQVQARAQRRLLEAADPVAAKLVAKALGLDDGVCSACGRGFTEDNVLLRAQTAVLDRAGLGPTSKIEVEQTLDVAWMEYLEEDEVDQIIKLMEIAKTRIPADDVTADDDEVFH